MIGQSFEVTYTTKKGEAEQFEIGPHQGAKFGGFFFGQARRVGKRYENDAITFWNPGKLGDEDVLIVWLDDLATLNIRKLSP